MRLWYPCHSRFRCFGARPAEATELSEQSAPVALNDSASRRPSLRERLQLVGISAFFTLCAVFFVREGLSRPTPASITGAGEIIACREQQFCRAPPRVFVRVARTPGDLVVQEPQSYLAYVRAACAAKALVSWSAVLRKDGQAHLVAFERACVPGGLTEEG